MKSGFLKTAIMESEISKNQKSDVTYKEKYKNSRRNVRTKGGSDMYPFSIYDLLCACSRVKIPN